MNNNRMESNIDGQEIIAEDYICEKHVEQWTGLKDMSSVEYIECTVDTNEYSMEQIGELVPNLIQLRLEKSVLNSFRDLGTQLRHLQILWVNRCKISQLDGIGALIHLQELYVAFNDVQDISPLAMHDTLRVLDVECNDVADIDQLDQLGTCLALSCMNLDGNPITNIPRYRSIVLHFIPQLTLLDEKMVDGKELVEVRKYKVFWYHLDGVGDGIDVGASEECWQGEGWVE